jgi:hypothetical protein
MLIARAIEILERMRDGKEPVTGKILTTEGPWQSADVVRALYTVLEKLPRESHDEAEPEDAPRRPRLARAGKPWTDEEDRCLAVAFDEGRAVPEIARVLDRSRKAVRLRLVKLGRMSAEDVLIERSRATPQPAAV